MKETFRKTGKPATFPLFPGRYKITIAQPIGSKAGDVIEGTLTIDHFAWAFINVGEPKGFNEGKTDFRLRTNIEAERIMSTPGDTASGYVSGHPEHDLHYRGYSFEDITWEKTLNISDGYASIEVLEEFPKDLGLFNLKSYYDKGEHLEIVLPNNQTRNCVLYKQEGIWKEVYKGRDTIIRIDTSKQNHSGKIRYRMEIDGEFVTVGESREFVVGSKTELDVSVNIGASNRFFGIMDIVPPPYVTHNILPIKDSLVRKSAPHVNYGTSSSLTVGHSLSEEFETLLTFNLDAVPKGEKIDHAELELTLLRAAPKEIKIALLNASNSWYERAVRWENKPDLEDVIFEGHIENVDNTTVRFDLTDFVTDWYASGGEERSFALVLLDESNDIIYFGSKESYSPPYLKVSHFIFPPNAGVHYMDADMLMSIRTSNDLDATADLQSDFNVSDLIADVFFIPKMPGVVPKDPDDDNPGNDELPEPVYPELEADVVVSLNELSDLTVEALFERKEETTEIEADMMLRGFVLSSIDADTLFEKKALASEIESDAVIAVHERSELDANYIIPVKERETELDVDALVYAFGYSEVDSDVQFFRKFGGSQLLAEAEIRAYGDSELLSDVRFVAKPDDSEMDADSLFYTKDENSEIPSDMILSIRWASELDAELEIEVKRPNTYGFIL